MPRYTNRQVADIFYQIADLSDIKGEDIYRVLAYRKAADSIANLGRDINELWREGKLREIPGVGTAIAEKISELLDTGQMTFYQKLIDEVPLSLVEVLRIPDVGPKKARAMWQQLGLTTVAEVKAAAEAGQLRALPGFGPKTEARILAGIEALARRVKDRVHMGVAFPAARDLVVALARLPQVQRVTYAGSLRRFCPTIGDLDILAATETPAEVMAAFRELPQVETVLLSGGTKTRVRLLNGLEADLRCLPESRWGTALQYFTGSQAHNVKLRELALKQGFSLSEYGLAARDGRDILCVEEEEVYRTLGLPFIEPELREDRGEIEAALRGELPRLLSIHDIRGEVHCHSAWSDGVASIEEMALAAETRGYEYLTISDHSQGLGMTGGLGPERLREQRLEIQAVQDKLRRLRLLQGIEVEIKADGSLDLPDEVLAGLDFVVASVHSGLRQDRDTITARVVRAMRHPHVHAIGHPSGRLLTQREESAVDLDEVLRVAAETSTMVEINAAPERLDLDDAHVRRAAELGVRLLINTDAHRPEDFDNLLFGVATARRGWAGPEHVANTLSLEALLACRKGGV
ncbi:MAG: DNA polymerase/3'-5' exonuclease PolX [Anaerolineae bacterium]